MTRKEQKAYTEWMREMYERSEQANRTFREMQDLYKSAGGGKPSCSMQHNFEYLMTSADQNTRSKAMYLYGKHYEANGYYEAMLHLGRAFANAQ